MVFDPNQTLDLNKYYTVTLTSAAGVIGKDFLVTEDPEVIAVFPHAKLLPLRVRLWIDFLKHHYGQAGYWKAA